MRLQTMLGAIAVAILGVTGAAGTAKANSPDNGTSAVCTWGGTPAAPTGRFTFTPGLTQFTPSSGPLKFWATGELSGGAGCQGKMVFRGVAEPGAICPAFVTDGKVEGVPGVARFWRVSPGAHLRRGSSTTATGALSERKTCRR